MTTPVEELEQPHYPTHLNPEESRSSEEGTFVNDDDPNSNNNLHIYDPREDYKGGRPRANSQSREEEHRLQDELAMLQAERVVSDQSRDSQDAGQPMSRSRSRPQDHVDEFDEATNPLHEKTAVYKPPEHPTTKTAAFFKKVHNSSFLIRYFTYIFPLFAILLIPLLLGALLFKRASVGGVSLLWFCVWLEIVWLTLWAGRVGYLKLDTELD